MASQAISGFGTFLKIGDGATPEVFTTIAEVHSIAGPKLAAAVIDVTSHSSVGAFREHISSLLDAGDLTFDMNLILGDATQNATTGVLRDYMNRIRRNFQLEFPDVARTTWSFMGFVTAFHITAPIDKQLTASVTIKVTGAPTLV